jgi:hypothetical protein
LEERKVYDGSDGAIEAWEEGLPQRRQGAGECHGRRRMDEVVVGGVEDYTFV